MFGLARRARTPKPTRYPTTPEGFETLATPLEPKQKQLFQLLIHRAQTQRDKAKVALANHDRTGKIIPVSEQLAVDSGIGIRRSLIGMLLFLGPAGGVVLGLFGHAIWGLGCAVVAIGTALGLRAFSQRRMLQLELEPAEVRAMITAARADETGKAALGRWQQDGRPLCQRDYEAMGRWLGAQDLVRQWERVARLGQNSSLIKPKRAAWRRAGR